MSVEERVDSPMTFSEDDVAMKGYLTKLSRKKYWQGNQKPSYFILRTDTWALCAYKRPYDLILLGELAITADDNVSNVSDDKSPFTLQLLNRQNDRVVRFQAPDEKAFQKWMRAFEAAIHRDVCSGNNQEDHEYDEEEEEKEPSRKVKVAPEVLAPSVPSQNQHTHTFTASGQEFTLDNKYRYIKPIGTGAYGAVISAKNRDSGESVAIKKIAEIFDDLVDAKRILREVRLLGHFDHKNITRLLDLEPPASKAAFEDMYIITDLMETDLHQVIYSMQPMSDDHIKYFIYQTLCALYHIHSAGVLHRDIKPSNILLNANCDLKICDFGLARGGCGLETHELTEYVVTRWYRAPEIMLNCLDYTEAVDVWAVGCILAEMLQREPLLPGKDYIHQLKLIIRFLGTPKQEDTAFVKNAKAMRFLARLPISKGVKLSEALPDANPDALDLLDRMLVFNPEQRISVSEALQHPYLSSFYDTADLKDSAPFNFDFDLPDDELTKDALVDLLFQDIQRFHPDCT